jgi:hypothetical protein
MDAVDRLSAFLRENGYAVEQQPQPVPARLFAVKRGHSLGIFLPYTDYLFVHEFDETETRDVTRLRALHEQARDYAGSQMRVPKALRYRVPNAVTMAVSETGFSEEMLAYAKESKLKLGVGGERHSVYLLDLAGRRLVSQGLEATPGRYGATTDTSVNPTNRVFRMLAGFAQRLFAD